MTREEYAQLWPKNRPVYREPQTTYTVLRTPRSYHLVAPNTFYTICKRYVNKGEGERVATFKSYRRVRQVVNCPGCLVRMDESEAAEVVPA